jgi:hypothetical protein
MEKIIFTMKGFVRRGKKRFLPCKIPSRHGRRAFLPCRGESGDGKNDFSLKKFIWRRKKAFSPVMTFFCRGYFSGSKFGLKICDDTVKKMQRL